jgi:hypothetical protein
MNYLKSGLKVLVDYLISLLVFGIFIYVFISITGDNFSRWLPVYSFVIFLLTFLILYSDFKKIAVKEKRPQYDLKPYPLKGLIYGVIGFSPFMLLGLIYPLISFGDQLLDRIKELAFNTLLGPLYFIVRLGNETAQGYAIALLVVPVIVMLGYMSGYYGFEMSKYLGKSKSRQNTGVVPEFKKSPWNPSVNEKKSNVKKTKKR